MTKRNKLILLISGLVILVLLGCGFKSFNKFTPDDMPLLVRSYSRYQNNRDGWFAKRQIYRLSRTPDGLSELIKLTDSPNGRVKSSAEKILRDITAEWYSDSAYYQATIELLNDLIEHKNPSVRKFAYSKLFNIASCKRLNSQQEYVRMRDSLVDGLRDPAFEVSEVVIGYLTTRYDDDWEWPIDPVMEIYNENSDPETHLNAAVTLATIDPDFHDPIQVLIDNLEDSDYDRQQQILSAIRNYGEAAVDVLPVIIRLIKNQPDLREDHPAIRLAHDATWVLHSTGAGDGTIITQLIELMYDENPNIRRVAVDALGNLESDGIPALPALKEKLNDMDEINGWIPMAVVSSITSIYRYAQRDKIVLDEIDYLLELLESDRMEHQILAVEGLVYFADDPRALEALDTLREITETPYTEEDPARLYADNALLQIEIHHGIRNPRNYSLIPSAAGGN